MHIEKVDIVYYSMTLWLWSECECVRDTGFATGEFELIMAV